MRGTHAKVRPGESPLFSVMVVSLLLTLRLFLGNDLLKFDNEIGLKALRSASASFCSSAFNCTGTRKLSAAVSSLSAAILNLYEELC